MKTTNEFTELGLSVELMLRQQLYDALQIDATELILKEAKLKDSDYQWKRIIDSKKLIINDQTSPQLHKIFNSVRSMLGYNCNVQFLISDYNGFSSMAYYSFAEEEPCFIGINASILDVLTERELVFIIGREMGNLLSGYSRISQTVRYVYPDPSIIPPILEHKLNIWNQLSETISDWYGFLVCDDFRTCISAILKVYYPFSAGKEYFAFDTLLNNIINNSLDYLAYKHELSLNVYPINPARISFLQLFSKHVKVDFKDQRMTYVLEEAFHSEAYNFTREMLKSKKTELDVHMATFIAQSGLLVADIDGKIDEKEIDLIAYALSEYTLFPDDLIKKFQEEGNINLEEKVKESLQSILRIKPSERERLFRFLIRMVSADEKILKEEVQFIFEKGKTIFGYSENEIASIFTQIISKLQQPSY